MKGNRTTILGAVVAVVGALLLAVFVVGSPGEGPSPDSEETATVLRAAEALPPGTASEELAGRVERVDVPAAVAPERRLDDLGDVAGQELLRGVGPGEILVTDQFALAGPLAGGLVVPAGYEAMSVEADPAPGVEGYVTPGSRVNVYVTVDDAPAEEGEQGLTGQYTQLVLGHVDVLAVTRGDLTGQARSPEEERPEGRIVLLLQVRPADAPVLIDSLKRGDLWFTIVNPDDPPPTVERVSIDQLDPGVRTQAITEARAQQEAAVQGASQP